MSPDRDAETIVEDALLGMDRPASLRFFGWSIAIATAIDLSRVVATELRSERRFRVYGGIFSGATPWKKMVLPSLDRRFIDPKLIDDVVRVGGVVTNKPGESRALPNTLILGLPPEHWASFRTRLENAHVEHYRASIEAGPSLHANRHRPDILQYLVREAELVQTL